MTPPLPVQMPDVGFVRINVPTASGKGSQISVDRLLFTLLSARTGDARSAVRFIRRASLSWDAGRIHGKTRSRAVSAAALMHVADPALISKLEMEK